MQDDKPIIHIKIDQNLFMFNLVIPSKIMQINRIANVTITISQKRSTYLINYSKKA